ncbi:single-stranded-DNA-specific exonuclease RecJ [Candidatus Magnetoovum chiemensis]|nr:single-stranded-DNA-specific exonuclease RecJ [Candidatus Magnetoovum chiemensis]
MKRRWFLKKANSDYVKYLSNTARISPILAMILINRDIKTTDKVKEFFNCGLNNLSDPFRINGMDRAVDVIRCAVKDNKKILIHGDYDADGTTAAAILYLTLKKLDALVDYFIPDRFEHGYGFSKLCVKEAYEKGVNLIITVDCGISSFETAALAKKYNIDLIITDHHEPVCSNNGCGAVSLPEALSIINPKIEGCSDLSILTGAGIAFKLSQALIDDNALEFIDLAAIGTIADVSPLLGENRIIVKNGLKKLRKNPRVGISALLDRSSILASRELEAELLSFTIIPRLNAAGRMERAYPVVKLLTTDSADEAKEIAAHLDSLNSKRQRIEGGVLNEAIKIIEQNGYDKVIVIANKDWHEGVLGIVASKLADRYNVPAFVLNINDGIAKGSARSINSIDLYNNISNCKEALLEFGGHKQAAGIKLNEYAIEQFNKLINSSVEKNAAPDDFIPTITIDSEISFNQINSKLIGEILELAPFGYGNPEPLLGAKGLKAINPKIVGRNHLKLSLSLNGLIFDAIGFNLGSLLYLCETNTTIDAIFTPTINEFNGSRTIQLNIKALRQGN